MVEGYYKEWRDLERAVQRYYIGGENWRELFRALIIGEGYRDAYLELSYRRRDIIRSGGSCLELLYRWGDIIRGGEVYLELLYRWRDLERAVWSCYNWGGISRGLFKAVILVKGYYEGWRDLERLIWSSYCWAGILRGLCKAFILAEGYNKGMEGSGEACSELLYWRKDIEMPVYCSYISDIL